MIWTQSNPVASLWTTSQLAYHLQLDSDVAALTDEQTYLSDLLETAVAYAEDKMGTSLITRTITAKYYIYDLTTGYPPYGALAYNGLPLPRGPLQSITSVSDTSGTITGSTIQSYGYADRLIVPRSWNDALTVVYQAGYGDTAAAVPADIKHAVRAHVAFLYENRGDNEVSVPPFIEAFYRVRSRSTGIG